MLKQYRLKDYRFRLIIWAVTLSILGILIIGSAQKEVQGKQILGLCLGLVLMVVVSLIDYSWLLNFYWIYYIIGVAILAATPFVGSNVNGATRWIDLGFFQFQPSDIMKIILIIFFAKLFSKFDEKINKPHIIFFLLVCLLIPAALIEMQPDLSTTIAIGLVFCVMIFIAGLSYKIIGGIILICIPTAVILLSIITQPGQTLLEDYQVNRIMSWLNPAEYAEAASQQTNSIMAIASGQLYGKGLDNHAVSSVKNGNFIAESQTDFIFAVAGEELGFLGCCIIILLELVIAIECVRIGRKARDTAGTLICCGMGALIAIQCFINICVATRLMPNTGIPLPFVSAGLTSLVSFFIGLGFVLNIGLQVRKY